MAQQNEVRHRVNCPKAFQTAVALATNGSSKVPTQKRKEDAKKTLYLNRV